MREHLKARRFWRRLGIVLFLLVILVATAHRLWDHHREVAAARRVASSGGWVVWSEPWGPAWLPFLVGENLGLVTSSIRELHLEDTPLGFDDFEQISRWCDPEAITLGGSSVADDWLTHLPRMGSLRVVTICNAPVTDQGVAHIKKLKDLREVFIRGTRVSRDGAESLRAALPSCDVYWTPNATVSGLGLRHGDDSCEFPSVLSRTFPTRRCDSTPWGEPAS